MASFDSDVLFQVYSSFPKLNVLDSTTTTNSTSKLKSDGKEIYVKDVK